MGAHVWGPAFLRDHLLSNWQLNGWSMDWYAGMPTYRFYMVVPALAIVALDTVLPYGIAFKLVVVAGLVTLPLCCWAFGRLARFRYPLPELFAFAGLAFALDESFSIYGGNLKSTMAGEFSFSIALSLMILGFGLLVRSMETGRLRSWTAIVLALAIVSHGIVAIYTVLGALVIVVMIVLGRRNPVAPAAVRHDHRRHGGPAVGLVDRAVRRQPPVHDRHEVRLPAGRRQRLVLGHVLPAHGTARHPHHGAGRRRVRRVHRPPPPRRGRRRRHRPVHGGTRLPDPGQPAGHRPAVEPAPAAVHLPPAVPADDGRCGRDRPRWPSTPGATGRCARRPGGSPGRSRSPAWAWPCSSCSASCSRCCPAPAGGCSTTPPSRSTRGVRCARRRAGRTPRATGGRGTTSTATRAARTTRSTTTSCRRWPRSGGRTGAAGSRGRTTATTASTARRWR